MITPAEAENLIFSAIAPFVSEDCPLTEAQGRVLRVGVRADRDFPPFDRVTMDGYAMRAAALSGGTRVFRVEGVQAAGMIAQKLGSASDACIEVMTGAVLPAGADCVVPYEDTTKADAKMTVQDADAIHAYVIAQSWKEYRGEKLAAHNKRENY